MPEQEYCTLTPLSPRTPASPGGPSPPSFPGIPATPLKPGKPVKPAAPYMDPESGEEVSYHAETRQFISVRRNLTRLLL